MKVKHILILSAAFGIFTFSNAQAEHTTMNSTLIGAGSGALLGQAIGGDTEATLVGSMVGGVVGYMIGNELDRTYHPTVHHRTNTWQNSYSRPVRTGKPFGKRYDSYGTNRERTCKKEIKVIKRHGRTEKVVTKTCWYQPSERHFRSHRYRDRHNHRYMRDF